MKKLKLGLATLLCGACAALTTTSVTARTYGIGEAVQTFKVDVNGDQVSETIEMICYVNSDQGHATQMVVKDQQGQELWRSPQVDPQRPDVWAFGNWDGHARGLQVVGDIDHDGVIDAIAPAALPTRAARGSAFRIYRWENGGFNFVRQAFLVQSDTEKFVWTDDAHDYRTWVSGFRAANAGKVEVLITKERDGDGELRKGRGVLELQGESYSITRWMDRV